MTRLKLSVPRPFADHNSTVDTWNKLVHSTSPLGSQPWVCRSPLCSDWGTPSAPFPRLDCFRSARRPICRSRRRTISGRAFSECIIKSHAFQVVVVVKMAFPCSIQYALTSTRRHLPTSLILYDPNHSPVPHNGCENAVEPETEHFAVKN